MRFRNEYWFLSNMYNQTIEYNGHTFTCVEAAFQAQKDPSMTAEFEGLRGGEARSLGRNRNRIHLREDWESVKNDIMKDILRTKFSDPVLRKRLMDIKGEIVEDNDWDSYWGVWNGKGRNELGKILMELRSEYQKDIPKATDDMSVPVESHIEPEIDGLTM